MKPLVLLSSLSCAFISLADADADLDPDQLAVLRVQPLLKSRCMACHGNDASKIKGGYDMRESEGLYGALAIVPQKPEECQLYLSFNRVHKDWEAMPPKEADSLDKREIAWLRDWIDGGDPWPDEAQRAAIEKASGRLLAADGMRVKTSKPLSQEWKNRQLMA